MRPRNPGLKKSKDRDSPKLGGREARDTYSVKGAMTTRWSNRQAVGLNGAIRSTGTDPSLTSTLCCLAAQLSPAIAPKQHINKPACHRVGLVWLRSVPPHAF